MGIFSPGDKVWWFHTPSKGYGFTQKVAGIVQSETECRVKIVTAFRKNSSAPFELKINPARLEFRREIVEEVDQTGKNNDQKNDCFWA